MHHSPGVPERQQEREVKKEMGRKEGNSLLKQPARLKGSKSDNQERMRIRREVDGSADTRRQACAVKAM